MHQTTLRLILSLFLFFMTVTCCNASLLELKLLPEECIPSEHTLFSLTYERGCFNLHGSVFGNAYTGGPVTNFKNERLNQNFSPALIAGRINLYLSANTRAINPNLGTIQSNITLQENWSKTSPFPNLVLRHAYVSFGNINQYGRLFIGRMESLFRSWRTYGRVFYASIPYGDEQNIASLHYKKLLPHDWQIALGIETPNKSFFQEPPKGKESYAIFGFHESDGSPLTQTEFYNKTYFPTFVFAFSKKINKLKLTNVYEANLRSKHFSLRHHVDFELSSMITFWGQFGYKNWKDSYIFVNENGMSIPFPIQKGTLTNPIFLRRLKYNTYGDWGGTYYGVLGVSFYPTDRLIIHAQSNYDSIKTLNSSVYGSYALSPNLTLLGEFDYIHYANPTQAQPTKFGTTKSYQINNDALGATFQVKVLF